MSFEPTEEMKAAYNWAKDLFGPRSHTMHLADLAQHATAAALEAEHMGTGPLCNQCYYTKADWLKLADEKLRK